MENCDITQKMNDQTSDVNLERIESTKACSYVFMVVQILLIRRVDVLFVTDFMTAFMATNKKIRYPTNQFSFALLHQARHGTVDRCGPSRMESTPSRQYQSDSTNDS